MGFADRAVAACEKAIESGDVSERHIRDVLKSKTGGESCVRFLVSKDVVARRAAARIVGEKGPVAALVKAALVEEDRALLLDMLRLIGRNGQHVEAFEALLSSADDMVVRDAVVEMFRRAGRPEYLFPMLFSDDDATVARIKRYMDEQGQGGKVSDSRRAD